MEYWDDHIGQLCETAEELYPDPIDIFENSLARKQGLFRHPTCPLNAWRECRAAFLDARELEKGNEGE